ncbi:sodium:pantothenate symporter [Clostridiales bacterium PH28_bin88]|nr:sodium:pantothenate symporter [Clostridiales bacterium PH28_bin88]
MGSELTFGGWSGVLVLLIYAALMLIVGIYAARTQTGLKEDMSGYYLAGRDLGFIALFFTLYATQYSGNTVVGYAAAAYRTGFSWLQSVQFMMLVIAGYLLFAPRLYALSKRHKFVTPTDWLQFRFNSKAVSILGTLFMLWGLGNYLLEQLVAIGQGVQGLTAGTIPYQVAVIAFVVVMLVYEWMGGMKAVALTDVMQGIMLLVGLAVMLIGAFALSGGHLGDVTSYLAANAPKKIGVPPTQTSINWFSMLVLVMIGAAVYPHAIQRIYSAKSERILKRSLTRMVWMPIVTTGVVFIVGILALSIFPDLDKMGSERIVGLLANKVAGINSFFYMMMLLLFAGVVAAIVSTADSVLLSFQSMVSQDLYGRYINPQASDEKKIIVGKIWGIIAVAFLLIIAWYPPATLYEIFVLKFEVLIQVAPAFIIGLYWKRLSAGPVFLGMLSGGALAGFLTWTGQKTVMGIHGGILGLLLNIVVCVAGSYLISLSVAEEQRTTQVIALD